MCIGVTHSGRGDDDEGCASSFTLAMTPRQRSSMENEMEKIRTNMRDLATAKKESSENQREILALLKRDIDTSSGANEGNMNNIEQTQRIIKNFEVDMKKQKCKEMETYGE